MYFCNKRFDEPVILQIFNFLRILYINHYAGSKDHGMEYRPYYLSREWVRLGHFVRVLAGSYSHVRTHQPTAGGLPIIRPTTQWIEGIEFIWYPTPRYSANGIQRLRNIWAFLRQIWFDARKLASEYRPDVIVASSTYPLDIWVARRIARIAGARLVFEVHDLWPLSPIELHGMSPKHPFIWLCQVAENTAYRDADVVISMLPKVAEHMAAHGLDLRKLHIVPNGVMPDTEKPPSETLEPGLAECLAAYRRANCTIVGYAGSHGRPNALNVLLDAAKGLQGTPFVFVLVGDGLEKQALASRVEREVLNNVILFPPIPKELIPAFLSKIDVAYIGWQQIPIYRFGIAPNKLMDYMLAGCVVLHSVDAGNDPVAESGCGLTVPSGDPQAVIQALQTLAALPLKQRLTMGALGKEFVLRSHAYPVLARNFLAAILS
jgi:glycosyltransferase involved in cell wall biosynthesis